MALSCLLLWLQLCLEGTHCGFNQLEMSPNYNISLGRPNLLRSHPLQIVSFGNTARTHSSGIRYSILQDVFGVGIHETKV